jgi:hypothetical protein
MKWRPKRIYCVRGRELGGREKEGGTNVEAFHLRERSDCKENRRKEIRFGVP